MKKITISGLEFTVITNKDLEEVERLKALRNVYNTRGDALLKADINRDYPIKPVKGKYGYGFWSQLTDEQKELLSLTRRKRKGGTDAVRDETKTDTAPQQQS